MSLSAVTLSPVTIPLIAYTVWIILLWGYAYLSMRNFPKLTANPTTHGTPQVSIIVPVRNQKSTIHDCVNSLVALDYPNRQLIFVDGNSTDGTREILDFFGNCLTVINEPALPGGWVGKNWACHIGWKNSDGEILLFTDGDTDHDSHSLRMAVDFMISENVDMLTVAPRLIQKSFWEKVLLLPVILLIALYMGGKRVNKDTSSRVLGNGQYILIRREVYGKIGGHEAVHDKIVEDVNIAKLVRAAGFKLRVRDASDYLRVRMYSSLSEIWEGWRKNFYAIDDYSIASALGRMSLIFFGFLFPFVLFAWGAVLAIFFSIWEVFFFGTFLVALIWAGLFKFYREMRSDEKYALLFPLGVFLYLAIAVDSVLSELRGKGVTWKGRIYKAKMNPASV